MAGGKTMSAADYIKAARGARSREMGRLFEEQIKVACEHYRAVNAADIEKTPEPTKQISKPDKYGRFTACYEKKAQPDFKGTLSGGRSVVFEAKSTGSGKIMQDAVTDEQRKSLDRHSRLGAAAFVLVSFGLAICYRIPWTVWRDMKEQFGRKYVTPEDIRKFAIRKKNGVWDFLYLY